MQWPRGRGALYTVQYQNHKNIVQSSYDRRVLPKNGSDSKVIIAHIKDGGLAYIRDIDFEIAARQSGS
jgi:hypothetical protein